MCAKRQQKLPAPNDDILPIVVTSLRLLEDARLRFRNTNADSTSRKQQDQEKAGRGNSTARFRHWQKK
ncbi:hypothetical protein O9929_20495 [Vibrio lentus]|nr:hypothetical protein [Vibrio lentus]